MSLFGVFDIGKSAIFASQTALSVTSHNIANVNTPGFSRQEAILEVSTPVAVRGGYMGRGVTVSGIKRHYDSFIYAQLIGQHQNYGRSLALDKGLSQIEQLFNEAEDMGLSASLQDYFDAWHDVATNPESQPQRTVLLQNAETLVLSAKQIERGIIDNLKQTNDEVSDIVNRINSIASDIAMLNGKITQIEGGTVSGEANDLRDQRDSLLNDLSDIVQFTSYEDKNGSITVMVGMRNLVYEEKTNSLSVRINDDGDSDLYLDGINITAHINKGRIGGLIALRGDIESNSLMALRKLIASITKEINLLHQSGYGLDASTGNDFFNALQIFTKDYSPAADVTSATITDLSQLTLDEYDIEFDAANNYYVYNRQTEALVTSGVYASGNPISFDGIEVVITGAITATDSFFVSPLTDAIKNFGVALTDIQQVAASSSNTELPGNNGNAIQIAQLSDTSVGNLDGTFMDYYKGLISDAGTSARAASDSLKFDDNLLSELNDRRESVSGVSLDEEAANLIRFMRSFEAGARVIKVTDELLQTILNL